MAKKGFLAHYSCCGNSIYKRSTIFIDDNKLCSIDSFTCETANTTFYDGLLLAVADTFHSHTDTFLTQVQDALTQDSELSITDAVLQNDTYNKHCAEINKECHIYTLSPIQWQALRPNTPQNLKLELIYGLK